MKKHDMRKSYTGVSATTHVLPQDCSSFLIYSLSLLLPVTLPVLARMQMPQKQLRHHSPESRPHAGNSVVLLAVPPIRR